MKTWNAAAGIAALVVMLASPAAFAGGYQPVDKAHLPESKVSTPGLYLSAPEAYKMKSEAGAKLLFVDVRTKGEFMFLGSPTVTDANIPYVEMDEPPAWDAANKRYRLSPNSDFVAAVDQKMAEKHLGKADPVIVMCRSGDRSSRAASLLQKAGYAKVYSVVDGFEGDLDKHGQRTVNGWKNAGLPWSYTMDKDQAYLR